LAGRAALITGAAEGIGRGIALRFAKPAGATLVVDFNEEKGRATTEELRALGAKAEFFRCDVTQRNQVEAAVQACVDHFRIDRYPGEQCLPRRSDQPHRRQVR